MQGAFPVKVAQEEQASDMRMHSAKTYIFLMLSQWYRLPWKRLAEVMLLVLITAALWFTVAYASPCKPLPVQVRRLSAFGLPAETLKTGPVSI